MDEPSVADAKHALRAEILAVRGARLPADVAAARAAVGQVVLSAVAERGSTWRTIAGFRPLRTEPSPPQLLDDLAALDRRVIVPMTLDDRDLDWVEWTTPGDPLGRDAIAAADLVLVPALAVSHGGVRLGRGGGSYDRALRRARPSASIVGVLFTDELLESVPAEDWDVPVSAVVTPAGWQDLPRAR